MGVSHATMSAPFDTQDVGTTAHGEAMTSARWLTEAFRCGCVFEANGTADARSLRRTYCPDHGGEPYARKVRVCPACGEENPDKA